MKFDFNDPYFNTKLVKDEIANFSNVDWSGKTMGDVHKEFIRRFTYLPAYIIKVKKGTVLFRARKNEGMTEHPFNSLSQIGINPKENVKSVGRANISQQAVFYCSSNEETVVREATQWYINDNGRYQDLVSKNSINMYWNPFTSFMTISAWVVTKDLNIALLANNDFENQSSAIQYHLKNKHILREDENENIQKSHNLILDFFSDEFAKKNIKSTYDYIYSAYYASQIYSMTVNNNERVDGVQYTSVANNGNGHNMAISEMSFKDKISFLGANYCCAFNNADGKIKDTGSVLVGRDMGAMMQDDESFAWVPCTDEFDYIMKRDKGYDFLKLPVNANSCCKPVVRINSGTT